MAAATPNSRKPLSFVLPTAGGIGAFLGLFLGTGNGSGLIGMLLGAAVIAAMAYGFIVDLQNEKLAKWISVIGFGIVGYMFGGIILTIVAGLVGMFYHWLILKNTCLGLTILISAAKFLILRCILSLIRF